MIIKKILQGKDLDKIGLEKHDIAFLVENGLTVGSFGHIDIISEFEFLQNAIILGYDSNIPICCDGEYKGVFAMEPQFKRFVNSSVETFQRTILRYSKYCTDIQGAVDEDLAIIMVNEAIIDFKNIDPDVWSKKENYWPIIAQQMLDGNL
ncbi:hypothetical protein [Flavobacterium limi]|uniref:SUKH-3 immunity protein n=1 Tax=Flavobacterium limi TaxID=2045105 RepID=A0ABQ1UER8_9FLAO|nr:hypothetical protein [Flavobacterium limi]GGF16219.1 hypothetical protein GCM10011518_27010 [Flavobacterium limi]